LKSFFPAAFALVSLMALTTPRTEAQEVGFSFTRASSDHPELMNPDGYGGYVMLDLHQNLRVRLGFTGLDSGNERLAETCTHFAPRFDCAEEIVTSQYDLKGINLALIPSFRPIPRIELGAGGGFSFMHLGVSNEVESRRFVDFFRPTGGQTGVFVLGHMKLIAHPSVPVVLTAGVEHSWIRFSGCAGEESTYDPFCGTDTLGAFHVGLGYLFGGL
jgi:hypothetical protein